MSNSTGMDPCTLSSIKLVTACVLILSPYPSTPESCQTLLFTARAKDFALFTGQVSFNFYHLSAVFLAAYAASWMFRPTETYRVTLGIKATGSVFLLYRSVQNKVSRGKK